jgi:hypothetical protein
MVKQQLAHRLATLQQHRAGQRAATAQQMSATACDTAWLQVPGMYVTCACHVPLPAMQYNGRPTSYTRKLLQCLQTLLVKILCLYNILERLTCSQAHASQKHAPHTLLRSCLASVV